NTVKYIGGSAFANCYKLGAVNVPLSVVSVGRSAFRECSDAVIYCEANSQPSSWNKEWDKSAGKIVWGITDAPVAVIEEPALGVLVYTEGRTIVVENATDEILVYNIMGTVVGRDVACNVCTITINNPGLYIVKTGNTVQRVVVN
ncbi:MAG: leucine-rich repeat protein, partial [Salinivirgaceae bacterium]|nr:leucine-rich repeat protein [Salinivirgaceae bacterium]